MAMTDMKNETRLKIKVFTLVALAVTAVALSGCNTVRGVAQDVTDAADAIDPSNN
jgi:predicted small secreted protein